MTRFLLPSLRKFMISSFIILLIIMTSFLSGCVKRSSYMVEMRDGIHLATDVYVNKRQTSPHGVILIRTPYNKNLLATLGFIYAQKGWPTVIQDTRGRYASEDIDRLFRTDHTDGYDTVMWIANQSFCNGKIATFGSSALAIAQYLMAGTNPPHLACQYIDVGTPDLYKHAIFHGGELRYNLVVGWLEKQGSTYILPEIYANENYSLDFWSNVTLDGKWSNVNVPAIHHGGWYDIFLAGTIEGFIGYQYLGGPNARGKSKLIIGPWTHTGSITTRQGELNYPENSIDTFTIKLFWEMAKKYTMNTDSYYDDWPAVMYYVMGDTSTKDAPGNEWRTASDWPVPSTDRCWYMHSDRSLSTTPPCDTNKSFTYTYGPSNPVPTIGGQNLNIAAGPYDQSPVENRDDVLVFTSGILDEPYEATGSIKARLYVSSDCPDTDFTVKLTDVYPDGRSMLITDGIIRMRNRNGTDHWEFMEPNRVYEAEVDLWYTSYIWNKGHRIRVSVSSSNYPRFLNNPNTRDGLMQNKTYNIAHNTLHVDKDHPSCIMLPEVRI